MKHAALVHPRAQVCIQGFQSGHDVPLQGQRPVQVVLTDVPAMQGAGQKMGMQRWSSQMMGMQGGAFQKMGLQRKGGSEDWINRATSSAVVVSYNTCHPQPPR
jgi:hypothetical protein